MKKFFALILLIIFSSFFLVFPNSIRAANMKDQKCTDYGNECAGASDGATSCLPISLECMQTGDCNICSCTCQKPEENKSESQKQKEEAKESAVEKNDLCFGVEKEEYENCRKCMYIGEDLSINTWTDFGCLSTRYPSEFIGQLLKFGTGLGGGIAFLFLIFGGIQIILSGGNPERVKAGKEMITAAIGGLLLIIFSVFILRLVGYDILKIPGFGK